jgi:signal transduction histidine kinase
MLGRQQIAGSSTAISELFKNAHDAYADHAEGDYFKSDGLLVIRDDGFGMTPEEFEDKWLVLGTESKMQVAKAGTSYRPSGKKIRPIMGEKGIGRLAIALLGRQVLVLTRAKRGDVTHDLVMCFLHWGIFELPGLNLDEIEIPVRRIRGSRLPTAAEVKQLVEDNRQLIGVLKKKYDVKAILEDLNDFQIDPTDLDASLNGLSLKAGGTGTHFYIAPANASIGVEIESEREGGSPEFTKFLIGFCNSTFLTTDAPPLATAFRYWETDESGEDIIGAGEFFTKEEVNKADHKISGVVDEYGQFKGTIRVYDQIHADHVIPWKEGHGKLTACGPFALEFAYLQGAQRESTSDPEDWARLNAKLEKIGGLYVYRDRIRILPYGNSDVDWVEIELRRNKGAGYYFFSWRRIFGAVCLTRKSNGELHEKAGREGFQQDKAYRQFKGILVNFFIQLAADFFRDNDDDPTYFHTRKRELALLELARRRREKMVSTKRRNLTSALDGFFQRTAENLPEAEIDQLKRQMEIKMAKAAALKNPDDASSALLDAERAANRKLNEIRESYRVARPRGVGLSQQLQRDWDGYSQETERLELNLFGPFSADMARTVGSFAEKARLYVDQRRRVEELLKQLADEKRRAVKTGAKDLADKADQTQQAALRTARDAIKQFQEVVAEVEADFARQDFAKMAPDRVEEVRSRFEQKIEEVGRRNTDTLAKVRDLLAGIAQNLQPGELDVTGIETMEALESDLETLKEQSNSDAELVQLGLAVAVINHEFEAAIKGIRSNLRDLHSWARSNEDLSPLYQKIRNNFDHLDGHLNLFTPLQRRLYRDPITIKGGDINHYVASLFDVRLKRHQISIRATPEFLAATMIGYPSTVYPVFVNVIDNAIFWLKEVKGNREITLDADKKDFLIINNGPAVATRDRSAIFEQGFTRKPRGRGLGLFISRRALKKEGMDLKLDDTSSKTGVTFRIENHA